MRNAILRFMTCLLALAIISSLVISCSPPKNTPTTPTPTTTSISEITIGSLAIASANTGQPSVIEADITNPGQSESRYPVVLKINEQAVENQEVTIGPGEVKRVSFKYTAGAPGTYKVDINGLTGNLDIIRPAEFKVSSLEISPAEIKAGDTITVNAEIKNTGGAEGTYAARLTLDGREIASKDVTIGPEASQKVSFTAKLDSGGPHSIEMGGVNKSVNVLKPAELKVSSMKVTPGTVFSGQEAEIEAEVTNAGDTKGTLPATLSINGEETDSQLVSLEASKSAKVVFKVSRDAAGKYDLKINTAIATLNVADSINYKSKAYYYSIKYPQGWKLDDEESDLVSFYNLDAQATIDVTINTTSTTTSFEEYANSTENSTPDLYPEWKILSQDEIRKDGVLTGYRQAGSYTTSGTVKTNFYRRQMKAGRYVFEVMGYSPESIWDANKALIEACLDSFTPPEVAVGKYTDDIKGYELTLPSGWDAIETGDKPNILIINDSNSYSWFLGQVALDNITGEGTAREYVEEAYAAVTSTTTSSRIESQGEVNLGKYKGYAMLFSATANNITIKARFFSVVRGSQIFTIVVASHESFFNSNITAIDSLINSFKVVEPRPFGVSRQDSFFESWGEIVTLDPALSEESPAGLVGAIFSGLTKLDKDLNVIPDLAEKWEVSNGGRTYTFHLHEKAKFQDGKPVTAQDIKYSWERACDPRTASPKASTYLGDILGVGDMLKGTAKEIRGIKVLDDHTLEVTIDGPKPYFPAKLTQPVAFVVDKANVARGKTWTDKPNGTGPFKLKEWEKDDRLILERNEDFYLGPAKVKNVVLRIFAGRPMMMYENNEIDMANVSIYDLERVTDPADPLNKELITGSSLDTGYIGFNVTQPPFDDPKVRQAFALALDMDKLLEVTLKGVALRASGFLPPGMPGHNADLQPLPFDPVQARKLIAESKYGSVDKLPPVTFYTAVASGPLEDALVAMWKQNLGVNVTIEIVKERKEWIKRRHNRELQLFESGWRADYLDPQNFLEVLFQSQSEENTFSYSNPEVDAALKAAAVEADPAKRLKMYRDIEKMILDDLPAVPFYCNGADYLLLKPYVKGITLEKMGINQWKDIIIEAH